MRKKTNKKQEDLRPNCDYFETCGNKATRNEQEGIGYWEITMSGDYNLCDNCEAGQ